MHEMLPLVIFYIFAAIAVGSAFMVVTDNNPVRCVLFLVLAFFASSVLWILVKAEFLALILVLVYVGAVMTLFLFVIMMLNIEVESKRSQYLRYLPFGLIIVALLVGLLMVAIPSDTFNASVQMVKETTYQAEMSMGSVGANKPTVVPNTLGIGLVLYTDYVLAFELAAMILLVSIIAAISLVHRQPQRSKKQDIVRQIMTNRHTRVELIKMKSE